MSSVSLPLLVKDFKNRLMLGSLCREGSLSCTPVVTWGLGFSGFFIIETVSVQIQIWLVPDIVKLFRFLYSRLIAGNFPAKLTIVLDSCEKYVVVSFIYREIICIFWIFIVNQFCSVKVSGSPVLSLSSL